MNSLKALPFLGPYTVKAIFPDKAKGHNFEPSVFLMANDPEFGEIRIADIPDVVSEDSPEVATAHLFAQAPEMLVALKAAINQFWADSTEQHRKSFRKIHTDHWINQAEAAITKAGGGA